MSKYTQGDLLSILYDVWISGTKLGINKKACITSIDVKETDVGSDTATIKIVDPEFLYIEDDIFIEDNTIKIKMGWDSTTHRVNFEGYISAIDIDFDNSGCPKLTITCMDNTHIMNRKKKDETFSNCTSADVVKKKCKEYGFACVIEKDYKFKVQESITQSKQTDIDFITKLANDEVYPFTARLVGNTFYYVKTGKLTTPKMTLTYRKYPHEIISFNPKINKETKQVEITGSSVDTSSKTTQNTSGSVSSRSGSSSSGDESTAKGGKDNKTNTNSGGYSYNPDTKTWSKN